MPMITGYQAVVDDLTMVDDLVLFGVMSNVEIFFKVGLMGFSLLLFAISAISYKRIGSQRLLFVCIAFAIFFVKGLVLTLGIFIGAVDEWFSASIQLIILDFLIMILLYLGIAKR